MKPDRKGTINNGQHKRGLVHVTDRNGHRAAYQDLFASILRLQPEVGLLRRSRVLRILFSRRVLFATISVEYHAYFAIAIARALIGKPTCGLFLGAQNIAPQRKSFKSRIGAVLIKVAKRMQKVTMLTICPYSLRPSSSNSTDGWIYDPQLWDIVDEPKEKAVAPPAEAVRLRGRGKPVIIFAGKGSKDKGFSELVEFAKTHSQHLSIIIAGKIDDDCKAAAGDLREMGMYVDDRYVPEKTLRAYYELADFSWCVYREKYDRPSGVFGRSLQFGVIPIVRTSSFLEKFSAEFNLPVILSRTEDTHRSELLTRLQAEIDKSSVSSGELVDRLRLMKEASMLKIRAGLMLPAAS